MIYISYYIDNCGPPLPARCSEKQHLDGIGGTRGKVSGDHSATLRVSYV
jgi:hypothetical protein